MLVWKNVGQGSWKALVKASRRVWIKAWTKQWMKGSVFACTLGVINLGLINGFTPASAEELTGHFAQLVFPSTTGLAVDIVEGGTGGTFSLTSLSQYDDQGKMCSGYSHDSSPNHTLTLSEDVQGLSIWVKSNGEDSTLFVRGLLKDGTNTLNCEDDLSEFNSDAGVYRPTWKAGVYQIWVGSSIPGQNYPYQLEVQQSPLPQN